jgi:hypothetical protein
VLPTGGLPTARQDRRGEQRDDGEDACGETGHGRAV